MEERKMFAATCSECGIECEIPFEPTEGRPVKCRECFRKGRPPRDGGHRKQGWKKLHKSIWNTYLGIIKILKN